MELTNGRDEGNVSFHGIRNQAVRFGLLDQLLRFGGIGYRKYRHGDWLRFRAVPVPLLVLKGVVISSWETGILRPGTCES